MRRREPRHGLWLDRDADDIAHAPLEADIDVDVAIVGGGIVGTTAALLLGQADMTSVLLEAQDVGGGVTGNSTAKATYFHGYDLHGLIERLGEDDARRVIDGDRAALDLIRHWVGELPDAGGIDEVWHWIYTLDNDGHKTLEREWRAATDLGLETRWASDGELPIGTSALGVPDQLLIEPALLCRAFARHAAATGVRVHEASRVVEVDPGAVTTLHTENGCAIRARHVILATQVPILDRSLVFAACTYKRSHVIALPMDDAFTRFPNMYTGISAGGLSLRPARTASGDPVIVVAGNGHPLDVDEDGTHITALVSDARTLLGLSDDVEPVAAWLAHDVFPADGRPFVGPIHRHDTIHVATGFAGWGLARGVSAAMAIVSLIRRGHAVWGEPMNARRLGAFVKPEVVKAGLKTATGLVLDRITASTDTDWDTLEPGQGTIVRDGPSIIAVARDVGGELRAVSGTCTHLGCVIRHDDERGNWQCPCHGSRFAYDGTILSGPAMKPLEPRELPGS